MSENYEVVDRSFDWDDEIENDGSDFTLLPEGNYPFTVENIERGRSKGQGTLPACNMAIVTIRINAPEGSVKIIDNIVLHSKLEWKISQFFRSIGMKKHGEKLRMNWPATIGKSGRCKVIIEKWTGKDGTEKQSNRIDKYLDPDETLSSSQPATEQKKYW